MTMRSWANSQFILTSFQPQKGVARPRYSSPQTRQLPAQFLGCAEECVLGGFFRGVEHFSDGAQTEALVVLELKDHALARGEFRERILNAGAEDLAVELAGGV